MERGTHNQLQKHRSQTEYSQWQKITVQLIKEARKGFQLQLHVTCTHLAWMYASAADLSIRMQCV